MRKGTTPTLTFRLPYTVDQLSDIKVTIAQDDVILEKRLDDFKASDTTVYVTLTQDETFLFDDDSVAEVQLRAVSTHGEALASKVYNFFVGRCLDKEVLK